jgi:hypothetical protein
VDLQCFSKKDYNLLYINLKEIISNLRNPTVLPPSAGPVINDYKESLSTKKSVRFNFTDDGEYKDASPTKSSKRTGPKLEPLSVITRAIRSCRRSEGSFVIRRHGFIHGRRCGGGHPAPGRW